MNRKLITSKGLNWPEISEEASSSMISCLENELTKYPSIKRIKNPPKKLREKLKKEPAGIVDNNEEKLKSNVIKSHFLFGINSITRYIEDVEKKSKSILCVLVCKSSKPLRILTQHLLIMCSQKQIKAGCVNDLSSKMSNLFNINRASAIAILESDNEVVSSLLNQVKLNVLPSLPHIENPILKYDHEMDLKEKLVDQGLDKDFEMVENFVESIDHIFVFKEGDIKKEEKSTSLDFLSFATDFSNESLDAEEDKTKNNLTSFNDKKFMLFKSKSTIDDNEDEENNLTRSDKNERYFSTKPSAVEFKQFDISIKLANKEKSKQKNGLKNKLAELKNKKKLQQKKKPNKNNSSNNKNKKIKI